MPQFRGQNYAAFLFDMDGTMVDSSVVVERVWREWAERHGVDPATVLAACHGVRSEDLVKRFAPTGIEVSGEVAVILAAEVADIEGVVPVEGIGALIESLDPGRWAVVTSAPRQLAEVRLRAAGIPLPKVLIAAEDVERGKPDPQGFQKAAALLGVPVTACLVFEDSHAGIAAAKAAGAQVAIVGKLAAEVEGHHALVDYR
ncbi:HAD-IA family hydrolase [Roseomonas elaeocarpi]|uniref:HAD-IA family hydrolase n=1 Tax=Roseomonas elaeocarpi TaxID=907779 RepID=A0ABV6JU18_9PROT